jgi:signal peptidase I
MKSALIHSGSPWKRNAPAAFLLSLFFPGLGQVYNGEFSRGAAFQGGIALLVFTIPFYAARFPARNHLAFFVAMILSALLLWIASPVEAFAYAWRSTGASRKRYNTVPAYLEYMAVSLCVTALLCFVTAAFFTAAKVPDGRMAPALLSGERVLVDTFS